MNEQKDVMIHSSLKAPVTTQQIDQMDLKKMISAMDVMDNQEILIESGMKFREMMMVYNSAIKEVHTKLEILNDEITILHGKNTIESISSRIKKPASIYSKLKKLDLPVTLENIRERIDDVAGVRVICSFIDDIYDVADMLIRQDDIRLIKCKDYIKNPKANGYRSLHLLIEVPVFFSNDKQMLKVEIQIRTIAMNFWASLEHQLRYKKTVNNVEAIEAELKECSEIISGVDNRMQIIRDMLEAHEDDG